MINKVYLVVEDWSADFDNGVDINVFKDLEKAQEYIKQRIEEEEEENNDFYDNTIIEEDYYYSCYNDGYCAENRLRMYIEEKGIQ